MCRATRVAADFLDFIAFCRCSTGLALHPLKILVSHLPPPCAGRCRTEIWSSEKVSCYTGVSQLQLRVSRYTVQLRMDCNDEEWTASIYHLLEEPLSNFEPRIWLANITSRNAQSKRLNRHRILVAFQTQTQNRSVLATQLPKSHPR